MSIKQIEVPSHIFPRPSFRQNSWSTHGNIAALKPAPANSALGVVFRIIRDPPMLHFETQPLYIKPQRTFHVGHAEKRDRLLDVRIGTRCGIHGLPL